MAQPFQPLNIYDAPGVLVSQILDDEVTWQGMKNLLLAPDRLSPNERSTLTDKLLGDEPNRLQRTVMGVVTNPWVWLMFLTSPAGAGALKTGKSLFSVDKAYSTLAEKTLGFLERIVNSPLEVTRGSEGGEVFLAIADRFKEISLKSEELVQPGRAKLIDFVNGLLPPDRRGKITTLDPLAYRPGSPEREVLKELRLALDVRSRNLDHDVSRVVPEAFERFNIRTRQEGTWTGWMDLDSVVGPGGLPLTAQGKRDYVAEVVRQDEIAKRKWHDAVRADDGLGWDQKHEMLSDEYWREHGAVVEVEQFAPVIKREKLVEEPAILTPQARSGVEKFGPALEEFHQGNRAAQRHAITELLGDVEAMAKEPGRFIVDDRKVEMLVPALLRKMDGGTGSITLQGGELLGSIVGQDVAQKVLGQARNVAPGRAHEMKQMLKEVFETEIGGNWANDEWMPRNVMDIVPVRTADGKRYRPTKSESDFPREATREGTVAGETTGRVMPLTEREMLVHLDDLDFYDQMGVLSEHGREMRKKVATASQRAMERGETFSAYRTDYLGSMERYIRDTGLAAARDTTPVTAGVLRAERETIGNVREEARGATTTFLRGEREVGRAITDEEAATTSLGDALDRLYQKHTGAADRQSYIRNVAVPAAMGRSVLPRDMQYAEMLRTKRMMGAFADSWLGRQMEGWGSHGKTFIEDMRRLADPSVLVRPGELSGRLAGYLYTTHLGLNLGSIVMNLTQPLLLASQIGTPMDVMGAYGKAFRNIMGYAQERATIGKVILTPEEKLGLIRKHIPNAERLGIGPDFFDLIESGIGKSKGRFGMASELLMTGFEKSEWFNRMVSGHLVEAAYKRAGRSLSDPQFMADMERFVMQTQFGQGDLNTPSVFLKDPLRNPLVRQFTSFPLRSLVGALDTFPKMGGQDWTKGLVNTLLRGMGTSAVVYEVGKGLMGADMSRGLFAGSLTDLFGGGKLVEENGDWVPIPPVVSIPVDLVRGVANDNVTLLSSAVGRSLPGGVALMRAIGFAPQVPDVVAGLPRALQRTYVGWDQPTPDGLVPVYRADGALIDYRQPMELMAKGLGVDLGSYNAKGGLDRYLVKNRDEIVGYRRQLLQSLAEGDPGKARRVQEEFGRRFKDEQGKPLPLTVDERALKQYVAMRTQSRPERVLDRIPTQARPAYQRLVSATGVAPQLPRGALEGVPTAGRRVGERPEDVQRMVEEMRRRSEQVGPAAQQEAPPFEGFGGY